MRKGSLVSTAVTLVVAIAFLAIARAVLFGPPAEAQQQPDWSKVQIKATKVAGNIYMLEGQGGNIAASVGEDGIVIVDDQFAPLAEKIQTALKNLGRSEERRVGKEGR